MNMQAFYQHLVVRPSRARQHRLLDLTHVTRAQILDATNQITWLIWDAETPIP